MCETCAAGKVKDPAGESAGGVCKAASDICGAAQYSVDGVCTNCAGNLVPNAARDGCENCAAGKVKDPPGESAGGVCEAASDVCGAAQYSVDGACTNCAGNLVPNAARDACESCVAGKVKVPAGATADGVCKDATGICEVGQIGQNSVCFTCTGSVVPNTARTACVGCDAGKVKFPAGVDTQSVCVFAECICTPSQVGINGVCTDCEANEVPDVNRASCVACDGFVQSGVCKPAECATLVTSSSSSSMHTL
jgi:hypothetical protein